LLDYDGGGTLGADEFCDGILKSLNTDKPLELTKLLKQNQDILMNSREIVQILHAQDDEVDEDDDEAPKPEPKPTPKRLASPGVIKLEERTDELADRIVSMQSEVNQLLQAFVTYTSSHSSAGVKRAVAVRKA